MTVKAALIQLNSQEDKTSNLEQAERVIRQAMDAEGPDLMVLPEMVTYLGGDGDARWAAADVFPEGEGYQLFSHLARNLGVTLHIGSLLERDADQLFNTTVAFNGDGQEMARYRKLHLFDVTTPDGRNYRESDTFTAGDQVVTYTLGEQRVGCTICYDVRFPELYQRLMLQNVDMVMVPSAFTLQTGKDHWEVLLRARAIETQCYVLAPAQCGSYQGGRRQSYGNSMIVDPWGTVIARASDRVGFVTGQLDFSYLKEVRSQIPVRDHKVM
ncbi:MAG: carbon-nitrogen hydrolase family protein [Geminicoccaceae bacterium]